MSPRALLLISTLLLVSPWFLMPRRDPQPEVHGLLRLLWWINAFYCAFWHRLESARPAPLPEHGPAILIANHTCGIDHLVLQASCHRVLGFLIAQEFYDFWACRWLCKVIGCIPVRRDGRDVAATRAALRALKEGRVVPIFPEGRILATSGRELGEGKPGAAFIAMHARVPVVPAYIRGTPETKNVWKALITPSQARVVFGQPIDLSDLASRPATDKERLTDLTERLMDAIRGLRTQVLAGEDLEGGQSVSSDSPPFQSPGSPPFQGGVGGGRLRSSSERSEPPGVPPC